MRTRWLVTLLCAAGLAAADLGGGAQEGLPAPRFSARTIGGPAVQLDKLLPPHGAIVGFVDPRSQEGARALAYLQQSAARLAELQVGLVVLVINYSQVSSVQKLVKDNGLTLPLAHDASNTVARQYSVSSGATTVVVAPDGKVFRRFDATEQALDVGPKAMAAANELLEQLKEAEAKQAKDAAPADGGQPAPAATATAGAAPLARPTDEQTQQRVRNGWALIQSGYVSAALEDARMLAEQRGVDFMATLWLAYCLEAARSYPEAAVTYRRVLTIRPGHTYALQAVARIDPEGRWRTPADLPQPVLPPPQPAPEDSGATTRQGPGAIGD